MTNKSPDAETPLKNAVKVFLLFCFFFILEKAISSTGFLLAKATAPFFGAFDPGNTWSVITVHHLFQGLVALALVFAYARFSKTGMADFGFTRARFHESLRPVGVFCLFWLIIQFAFGYLHIYVLKLPYSLPYRINTFNFTTYFLFEVLLSGTSEEILFRSMILLVISHILRNESKPFRLAAAIGISTFIFMLDHISFTLSPFRLTHFNVYQQLTALVCALFYAWLIEKYKTVYSAMLAHNLVNGVITVAALVLFVTYPIA